MRYFFPNYIEQLLLQLLDPILVLNYLCKLCHLLIFHYHLFQIQILYNSYYPPIADGT